MKGDINEVVLQWVAPIGIAILIAVILVTWLVARSV